MSKTGRFVQRVLPVFLFVLLVVVATGCTVGPKATEVASAPTVSLMSPAAGETFDANAAISISSTSISPTGIQRVELWVDGVLTRVDVNPKNDSPYIVSQPWQSDQVGSHVIQVKAFDERGSVGESQPVAITIMAPPITEEATAEASSTPTEMAQTASTPTPETLLPTWTPTVAPSTTTQPPTPSPTVTIQPVCTPPACQAGELYYCPGTCTGGCGTQCATPTPGPTPTAPNFQPTGIEPHQVLKSVWEKPEVRAYLGYPTSAASDDRQYAKQYFEHGYMYWWSRPDGPGLIWVVEMPDPGANFGYRWQGPFDDTWDGGDKYSCDAAKNNPYGPVSGFGKLWCDHPAIAQAIGAARENEQGTGDSANYGVIQLFQGGVMLYSPLDRQVWVLLNGGMWQRHTI